MCSFFSHNNRKHLDAAKWEEEKNLLKQYRYTTTVFIIRHSLFSSNSWLIKINQKINLKIPSHQFHNPQVLRFYHSEKREEIYKQLYYHADYFISPPPPLQGFGSVSAEHWLGNEYVYQLTSQRQYALRVELSDWDGHQAFSLYDRFQIGSEKQNYR